MPGSAVKEQFDATANRLLAPYLERLGRSVSIPEARVINDPIRSTFTRRFGFSKQWRVARSRTWASGGSTSGSNWRTRSCSDSIYELRRARCMCQHPHPTDDIHGYFFLIEDP